MELTGPHPPPHWLHTRHWWEIHCSARQAPPAQDRLSRVTITLEQTVSRKKSSVPRSVEKFCPSSKRHCKMTQLACSRPPLPRPHVQQLLRQRQSCKFGGFSGIKGAKKTTHSECLDGRLDTTHFCGISKNPKLLRNYSEASLPCKE